MMGFGGGVNMSRGEYPCPLNLQGKWGKCMPFCNMIWFNIQLSLYIAISVCMCCISSYAHARLEERKKKDAKKGNVN